MAMPHSTANWHWKNKNCTKWARSWFETELVTVSVKGDGAEEQVQVTKVDEVDGDVELGQRKSKLITIYDCKVVLSWSGTASDGTEVSGSLTIPEVSHEVALDGLSDYVYEWSITTPSSAAVDALYTLAKKKLSTALEAKLNTFPAALLDNHGKDLTVAGYDSPSASGATTPAVAPKSAAIPAVSVSKAAQKAKAVNTSDLKTTATFMAEANDLFSLLTDESRIPMWTRAPAKSKPEVGSEYSLFGGGVKGKFVSLEPGKKIVQTWALQSPTWPAGHEATLTTTLDQNSDSTTVTFALAGVPKGIEDEITRNLEGYYVHGLKSIGYVQLILSPSETEPSSPSSSRQRHEEIPNSSPTKIPLTIGFAVLVLFAAVVPYFLS